MPPGTLSDANVLRTTTKLIEFLRDLTSDTGRERIRDITSGGRRAPDPIVWLADLPVDVRVTPDARDGTLLDVVPVGRSAPPDQPPELADRLDPDQVRSALGVSPELSKRGLPPAEVAGVERAYRRWLPRWQLWAAQEREKQRKRELYETLEHVAKTLDQQDDEYEFVLGVGLVTWQTPGGQTIRRHLLTTQLRAVIEVDTARVRVVWEDGTPLRLEDRELFEGVEVYRADRGRSVRDDLRAHGGHPLAAELFSSLRGWFEAVVDAVVDVRDDWEAPDGDPTAAVMGLTAAPALLLRRRSQALLAEAYQKIAAALREPGCQIPIGLAHLIAGIDVERRARWLAEQGMTHGDVLGDDPLFPLATNKAQTRILERLRTETTVVVQGPPGTGKTHTIANLICALLAQGQRVLVTSEKDQALRELRDKVPSELRQLCVLLTGASKGGAEELQRGIEALSEMVASTDLESLNDQAHRLAAKRTALRSQRAVLTEQIRALRESETYQHPPVVRGYRDDAYRGSVVNILREVKKREADYGWMPPLPDSVPDQPPLDPTAFATLCRLLRDRTPALQARAAQLIPEAGRLPDSATFAELVAAERPASEFADIDVATRALTALPAASLDTLSEHAVEVDRLLSAIGQSREVGTWSGDDWRANAIRDQLAQRNAGLWEQLYAVAAEPTDIQQRLNSNGIDVVVDVSAVIGLGLGPAAGQLSAGRGLLKHLESGGKMRSLMPSPAQRAATELLKLAKVNGAAPRNADDLRAAVDCLQGEVAVMQLVKRWSKVGVRLPSDDLEQALSILADRELRLVSEFVAVHRKVVALLTDLGVQISTGTAEDFVAMLDAIPAARRLIEARQAERLVSELQQRVSMWATDPQACPELNNALHAITSRDVEQYSEAARSITTAREERQRTLRLDELCHQLGAVHPGLLSLVERTAAEPVWEQRFAQLPDAWAWAKARAFCRSQRSAGRDQELLAQLEQNTQQLSKVTAALAASRGLGACLARMDDDQFQALNAYREHMGKIGAGYGKQVSKFRKAARSAMDKAKGAVPAWVVPLPRLLETISADRDAFDVVIVDEASQAGLERLFLAWMAPRMIVVGDDRQCAPSEARLGELDRVFAKLDEYLPDLDPDIRLSFTPKSSLYGLLSARAGMRNVIRLREHFRCMPEIIGWSSAQFYPNSEGRGGLIPLRQFRADRLEPIKVVRVSGAVTEGRDTRRRNPVEA